MKTEYLRECYKHRWILDYVTAQVDKLSYSVTNTEKLETRVYTYIGKYLMQNEENHKNKALIRRLVAKKIKESVLHFGGIENERIVGSIDVEGGANLVDCWSNQQEKHLDKTVWIETLCGDNPKYRAIVTAVADGYTLLDTADILTSSFGGKLEGNRTCIKRFITKCKKNKDSLFNALCI